MMDEVASQAAYAGFESKLTREQMAQLTPESQLHPSVGSTSKFEYCEIDGVKMYRTVTTTQWRRVPPEGDADVSDEAGQEEAAHSSGDE